MKAIFEREWNVFEAGEVGAALRYSDDLYKAALNQEYKGVTTEKLYSLLKTNLSKTDEHGLINICPGVATDREARVILWYLPSYVTIAIGIYLKNVTGICFDTETDEKLSSLMGEAFRYGIVGHGFDRDKMILKIMRILARAGTKVFLKREPGFNKVFTMDMEKCLAYLELCKDGFEAAVVLAEWYQEEHAIFVYGTLMQGESASYMLEQCVYAGKYVLKDYAMYNLGRFPGIKECKGESVCGEVYFVSDEVLTKLDCYEGEGSLYKRSAVMVDGNENSLQAEAYVYLNNVNSNPMRQPWGFKDDSQVWYAAYGSNLSEARFNCYIKGGNFYGKDYEGCKDKRMWKEDEIRRLPGELYFGNCSGRWNNKGVAFFDESATGTTIMRMYKITWGQLLDIQKQEGNGPNWYGKRVCLGYHKDRNPIYTLTSEAKQAEREPDQVYVDLIQNALIHECDCPEKAAKEYIDRILGGNKMSSIKVNGEVNKVERGVLNTTINKELLNEFKAYCKAEGVSMSTLLELCMKKYVSGEFKLDLKRAEK